MRKLASIQKIIKLSPIEGADRIECADILGWHCVVKKEEFKEGDYCVYFEVDSILPDMPCFEFLRDKKFKVKTRRFKKQISQGLALPIGVVEEAYDIELPTLEGEDVTAQLNVVKNEPDFDAIHLFDAKGSFPTFLVKTDEPRIQTIPNALERLRGEVFYVTEKLDGTSCTMYRKDGEFGVCSRNIDLKEGDNPYWTLAKKYKVKETLEWEQLDNIAIQGELFGIGIQKNPYKQDEIDFRVFSVFDIKNFKYLDYAGAKALVEKVGLRFVPVLTDAFVLQGTLDELVAYATKRTTLPLPYATNKPPWAEGIVLRPLHEKVDLEFAKMLGNGRVSFKVINPEYLMESE